MKKKILAIAIAAVLALGLLAACARNGAVASPEAADQAYWTEEPREDGDVYGGFLDQKNTSAAAAESETAAGNPVYMVNELTYGENVKLIFRAWLHLQTLDFAQAENELNRLVDQYHGYFESVYTDNGSYYANYSYLRGSYTVRIPAENYDRFLTAVGNTCHVVNLNKTTEDIGLQYSDTQMRLETVKAKQERLLALLKQATEMSDIIELESAISDCQYEIDSLTSTINRYDSLVGYSTVNIELEQVERLGSAITEEETFWEQLVHTFKEGLEDFAYGIQELIIWIAYHIVGIIVFIILVILIVRLWKKHAAGKIRLPKRNKGGKKEEAPDETER